MNLKKRIEELEKQIGEGPKKYDDLFPLSACMFESNLRFSWFFTEQEGDLAKEKAENPEWFKKVLLANKREQVFRQRQGEDYSLPDWMEEEFEKLDLQEDEKWLAEPPMTRKAVLRLLKEVHGRDYDLDDPELIWDWRGRVRCGPGIRDTSLDFIGQF